MINAIADCQNVHSKLFYLDQNLRNFCLPYYSNDPDESIQQKKMLLESMTIP